MRNLISVEELNLNEINKLLKRANEMKYLVMTVGGTDILHHKVMATLFYEPSTRTSCSFRAAMLRLGGSVMDVIVDQSSVQKGETLEDTIRTVSCYSDVVILRHPEKNAVSEVVQYSTKPLINAGDGIGEHPTQALLDVYTIYNELGRIGYVSKDSETPMKITLIGDLKHGRTVHSLVKLLALFSGIQLNYISPQGLSIPTEIFEYAERLGVKQRTDILLEDAIIDTDVLYVSRIQKERFNEREEYETAIQNYCINAELLKRAKPNMIVMHPLPRTNELSRDVDTDPRAAYFRQMENGMYMRMAILENILGDS